jgi:hypothetical protein
MSYRLHLARSPEPASLPTGALLAVDARRPGELYDLIAVGNAAAQVALRATRAGITFDVAATLLIECRLLRVDTTDVGLTHLSPPAMNGPRRRLSAAEADYLRALTFRRARAAVSAPRAVVPVRLISRITPTVVATAAAGDVEEAIAWEIAALIDGRTIGELGLSLAVHCNLVGS